MVTRTTLRPRVHRSRLPNGLKVLLAPRANSGTASVWVWYRVGSRNEWPGITGVSHWVEHMMFEGSHGFRKGEVDRRIAEVGGVSNAFTDSDFTAYLATVPREHARIPLEIEADRMTRARFAEREVARERTIVLSEREGAENWPEFRIEEELYATAFRRHPYRWDALGYPEDIRSMSREDLADYYSRFYGPRNATLVVAGGFEPTAMGRTIEKLFGRNPSRGSSTDLLAREPPIVAERRVGLVGPGTTPSIAIAWRAPDVRDPATPATMLLDVMLGGETRMFSAGTTWGPSAEHPSARLYRRLVDSGLAVSAVTDGRPRTDPGLFILRAQAAEGVSLDRLEEAIDSELESLIRAGPSRAELLEARTKVRRGAELAYEGSSRTAFRLGYFATVDRLEREQELLEGILSTNVRAVHRQAEKLFRPDGRVVVRYEPTGGAHGR